MSTKLCAAAALVGTLASASAPRGTCNQTSGNYSIVETKEGDSYVLYSDIRYGEIGSTLADPLTPPSPPKAPTQCPHPSTYGEGLAKAKAAQDLSIAQHSIAQHSIA